MINRLIVGDFLKWRLIESHFLTTIKIAINGFKVVVGILFCKLYFWIILSENGIGFKQIMQIPEVNIKLVVYSGIV